MIESLLTLVVVVALLLGSPGPAPLSLAAVGASVGVTQGLPFLFGVLAGLAVSIVGAILGLSSLFSVYPVAKLAIQITGSLYLLFVAFKIASAPVISASDSQEKVPSFSDGFVLNLLNPKAYAAFFAIFSQFRLPFENNSLSLLSTALVCMVVAAIVDYGWLALGGVIKPIFKDPAQARILRVIFALLMIGAVLWTLSKSLN